MFTKTLIITTTFHTTCISISRRFALLSTGTQQGCQVCLGVGIPVTFMLTAIITSLLTLLISYLCLRRGGSHKFVSTVQEPVYDPVSSGTCVETKSNVAYGKVTTGGHVTYENMPQ